MEHERAASPADLVQLVHAFQISQALHVLATLGIADRLAAGPLLAADLARATGAHPRALYRLLRAVASVGVLHEDGAGAFALTDLGQYLRADHAQSVHGLAVLVGQPTQWGTWQYLRHSVATGEPAFRRVHGVGLWEYRAQHPDAAAVFDAAMTSLSLQERDAVVGGYDFSRARTVVDVGGGHGALLAGVLAANPQARGVLFDEPHVVAGAGDQLRAAGVEARCAVVGGDFFESVPEGGDAYLMRHIIHDWDDDRSRVILRNCRRVVRPGGRLLLVETVIPPGNGASFAKFLDVNMLVIPGGRERTEAQYRDLLGAAGFRLTRVVPTRMEVDVIEAVPA
jgi:SAM-dependent methyltransferase